MPIAITALKPGDVVFDARKVKAGNTTTTRLVVWRVVIREVDLEKGRVVASWNSNPDKVFHARNGKLSWCRTVPSKKASRSP